MATKKQDLEAIKARTAELERAAAIDEENVRLRLKVAELNGDVARAQREASCEREARLAAEKRLKWIGQLAGSGLRPSQLAE